VIYATASGESSRPPIRGGLPVVDATRVRGVASGRATSTKERAKSSRFRCRLGKHTWRSKGRGDVLTYVSYAGRRGISRRGGAGAHQMHRYRPVVVGAAAIELRDGAAVGAATAARH
jgi:hypothetical protein